MHPRFTQAYSCDALAKVPPQQRCQFVRDSCESGVRGHQLHAANAMLGSSALPNMQQHTRAGAGGSQRLTGMAASPEKQPPTLPLPSLDDSAESLVPYAEWYYCYVAHHNVLLRWLYVVRQRTQQLQLQRQEQAGAAC